MIELLKKHKKEERMTQAEDGYEAMCEEFCNTIGTLNCIQAQEACTRTPAGRPQKISRFRSDLKLSLDYYKGPGFIDKPQ